MVIMDVKIDQRQANGWVRRAAVVMAILFFQAACAHTKQAEKPTHIVIEAEEGYPTDHPAVIKKDTVSIPVDQGTQPPPDYVIGPNDVLHINVSGQPHLGSPLVAGARPIGSRVDGHGYIQLPMVNTVQVAGKTAAQAQSVLQNEFEKFISKPWVVVEVLEHRSQPIYLVGQFNSPGVYYMDRPTDLLKTMALGRGLTEVADIRGARLLRSERVVPVDIYRLLREGSFDQNVWLKPHDTVYVPDSREQQVFVLGDVKQPGAFEMMHGRLTLSQALALAGSPGRGGSDRTQIAVIRSLSPTRGELISVDLEKILAGGAIPYPLMSGDIIYVPRSSLGRWSDVVRELLPSLQLVGATLQPFVQIEFLSDDDD